MALFWRVLTRRHPGTDGVLLVLRSCPFPWACSLLESSVIESSPLCWSDIGFSTISFSVSQLYPLKPQRKHLLAPIGLMFERPLILVQPKNSRGFSTISHNSMFFQTSPNWSLFSDSPWFTVLLLWPADLTQTPRCRLTSRLGLPAAFRDDALLTMFPRVHPIFNNNSINMYHFLDS